MADDPQPFLQRTLDLKTVFLGVAALASAFLGIVDPLYTQRDYRTNERQWELIGKHTDEIAKLKASTERYQEQIRENRDEIRELRREIEEVRKEIMYEYRGDGKRKSSWK